VKGRTAGRIAAKLRVAYAPPTSGNCRQKHCSMLPASGSCRTLPPSLRPLGRVG
jgi:hypothetical protein